MSYNFFAAISRMKYINRWQLMRNFREENLCEHSMEVAMIAHALCVIGNVRYGKSLDPDKAALIGLYHDASEIITGDMPTPVKYYSADIRDSYKQVETFAREKLLQKLPEDLRPAYEEIFEPDDRKSSPDELYLMKLVKAADQLSALIKCMEETASGNGEFRTALESTRKKLEQTSCKLPEVSDFMRDFLPPYGQTLDELSS